MTRVLPFLPGRRRLVRKVFGAKPEDYGVITMKSKKPAKEYIAKAKLLSREDAERVFARMRKRYFRRATDGDPVEAVAFQLQHEDEQLKEWRKKMEKLRAEEQGK